MKKLLFLLLCLSAALSAAPGAFTVTPTPDGDFVIKHRGKVLVSSVRSTGLPAKPAQELTAADGTRVWNLWNDQHDRRIRQEIALKADGSEVEITMLGEAAAYCPTPDRLINIHVPYAALEGYSYEGLAGNGRGWDLRKGTVQRPKPKQAASWRYLLFKAPEASSGVVFDLNPIGAGDFISGYSIGAVRGLWSIGHEKNTLRFVSGNSIGAGGGLTGAKVVLREGADLESDYAAHHALRRFTYTIQFPPQRLYSFGSAKHGKGFATADAKVFDDAARFGWLGHPELAPVQGAPEGAYYSCMKGRDALFRITGLVPGVHFVTVSCGNYTGLPNRFSITANGKEMAGTVSVARQQLLTATLPVWVKDDGVVDIQFNGDFLVSSIGTSFLLAKAEDFSFNRGIWVSDGYEPAAYFRNQDYRPEARLAPSVQRLALPVPGQEAVGTAKAIPRPVEQPDPHSPGLAWIHNAKFRHLGSNASDLSEYADPKLLERKLDELQKEGATAIMVSGMHSRHTYIGSIQRGLDAFAQIVKAAHKRGLKVIDHHDTTLLWNLDAGFRVMAQRTPETVLGLVDLMPNPQFCILNPTFTRVYRDYLLANVKNGVDGFQADELTFYKHGCGCQHCRQAFHEDTGWQLPMNELDPRLFKRDNPLWKTFLEWRKAKVANWWVEFRREARKINPDLTLCMYTTHYGFTSNYGTLDLGFDLIEIARAINFFGTEIMTRNCLQSARALLPYRKMKNLLRTAYGTPIWGWIYGSTHATNYFGWAACNMTGQSGLANVRDKGPDFFRFEASPDNMDRSKAENIARIAILLSAHSRDWQFGISMTAEAFGCAQTLEEIHAPYEFIGEMCLTPRHLAKYDVLFVGSGTCVSDAELQAILDFARNGGTVYLSTLGCMGDEMGTPRAKWPFADLFGFTPKSQGKGHLVKLGATRDAKAARPVASPQVAFLPRKYSSKNCPLFAFDRANRPLPVIYEKPLGKGRVVYQATTLPAALYAAEGGRIGDKWTFALDQNLAEICREHYRKTFAKAMYWQTDAPPKVYTTLYRQGDATLVHFLNATGANPQKGTVITPAAPNPAWPELQQDITFTIPRDKAREVYAVSPDFQGRQPLQFSIKDGLLTATLPKAMLHAYTIVWIK